MLRWRFDLHVRSRTVTLVRGEAGPPACRVCGGALVAPEAAADAVGLGVGAVRALAEAGRLHAAAQPGGRLLVCARTLALLHQTLDP
ncbi:MAG: hypothetical protein R3181_05860 [Rubricoccaceae bacterium]|nr:hypothetical protein [Rubricoccaceae bacterium]